MESCLRRTPSANQSAIASASSRSVALNGPILIAPAIGSTAANPSQISQGQRSRSNAPAAAPAAGTICRKGSTAIAHASSVSRATVKMGRMGEYRN